MPDVNYATKSRPNYTPKIVQTWRYHHCHDLRMVLPRTLSRTSLSQPPPDERECW